MQGYGALVQTALVSIPSGAQAAPSFGWFQALSLPVVKTKPGLRAAQMQFLAAPAPQPVVPFGWMNALSEPRVKTKPGLKPSQMQSPLAFNPQPFVSFGWMAPLSEPVRFKPGLRASQQHAFFMPERMLPTPTVTGTMHVIEQGDTTLWGLRTFGTPVEAMIGVIELATVPYVGIVEDAASGGAVGAIEDAAAPASGSPVVQITDAAVSIRII